jgi:hypothetical protein
MTIKHVCRIGNLCNRKVKFLCSIRDSSSSICVPVIWELCCNIYNFTYNIDPCMQTDTFNMSVPTYRFLKLVINDFLSIETIYRPLINVEQTVDWKLTRETEVLLEERLSRVPLGPHSPTWPDLDGTRTAAVGSRRLTAWATVRLPYHSS